MKFDQFTLSATPSGTVFIVGYTADGTDNLRFTAASLPISTATQTALDLKAALASPTFTGTVVLPSATSIGTVSATEIGYLDGVTSAVQTQLDAKLVKASNLSDLASASTARTNLGLGTAATRDVGQASGNVLELSAAGVVTLGNATTGGKVRIYDEAGNDEVIDFGYLNGVAYIGGAQFPAYAFGTVALTTSNVATATALATARTINGVSFDGTANITVTAAGSTLSDTVTVSKGGTGQTTLTSGAILTGNGTGAVTSIIPGADVATALAKAAADPTGGLVRTTDTATTTTAGVVPGLGGALTATSNALTVADYLLAPPITMAWERVTTATTVNGTVEGNAGVYYGCGSGTAAGGTSRVDNNSSSGDPWYFGNYVTTSFSATDVFILNGVFLRISNTSTGVWRFGLGKTHGGAVGQWTEAGFGFTCKNLRLWSFTHNGTTFTENDTGVDIPGGEIPMQFCIRRTSTAYEFYLNRALVATHTVAGYAHARFIRIEAENGANAAAQRMRISPIIFRFL